MSRLALIDDPQLQSFLPLLWVIWADGDADDAERENLRARVAAAPWLRPVARTAIDAWLDPDDPPNANEVAHLRTVLERVSATLADDRRRSLVGLAAAIATTEESAEAARELAESLGVASMPAPLAPRRVEEVPEAKIDAAALRRLLDGLHAEIRDQARSFLDTPER